MFVLYCCTCIVVYRYLYLICYICADPTVRAAYEQRVPTECTEKEFWSKYFQSQYYARDKGEFINAVGNTIIKQDDFFSAAAQAQAQEQEEGYGRVRRRSQAAVKAETSITGAGTGTGSASVPTPPVHTRRVVVSDPSVDLTATAEETCPSVLLAISAGGEVKTERSYNPFTCFGSDESEEGTTAAANAMQQKMMGVGAVKSSSVRYGQQQQQLSTTQGMLPIMRKYNRNSELVLTEQAATASAATGSSGISSTGSATVAKPGQVVGQQQQGLTVPVELERRLHSLVDPALVDHPVPQHIALHMSTVAATSGSQNIVGNKRRRVETEKAAAAAAAGRGTTAPVPTAGTAARSAVGQLVRNSNLLTLNSVHPTEARSLQFLRSDQQVALTIPTAARVGAASTTSTTITAATAAATAAAESDTMSTLRSVAGLAPTTSIFLKDPTASRTSTPSIDAVKALNAAESRTVTNTNTTAAAGVQRTNALAQVHHLPVVDLEDLPLLSLAFKQQAMLTYLQITELLRHFYSSLKDITVQQLKMRSSNPTSTPAYTKLCKIDLKLKEINEQQTSMRNNLKASPVSIATGWQAKLDILQDFIELTARSISIWNKYSERCQYYELIGTKEFSIDINSFIREMSE